jgi:hypothetical protein
MQVALTGQTGSRARQTPTHSMLRVRDYDSRLMCLFPQPLSFYISPSHTYFPFISNFMSRYTTHRLGTLVSGFSGCDNCWVTCHLFRHCLFFLGTCIHMQSFQFIYVCSEAYSRLYNSSAAFNNVNYVFVFKVYQGCPFNATHIAKLRKSRSDWHGVLATVVKHVFSHCGGGSRFDPLSVHFFAIPIHQFSLSNLPLRPSCPSCLLLQTLSPHHSAPPRPTPNPDQSTPMATIKLQMRSQ